MLKSIATASSKCTTKHQNKVNYNTDYIVPDMIGFLTMTKKRLKEHRLKEEIFIFAKNIILTINWFVDSNLL